MSPVPVLALDGTLSQGPPAKVETHAHDRIAGLHERCLGGVVGLGAGVGLHVDERSAEELLGALAGEVLHGVNRPAAAVIAPAGKAFGVLVGERAARCLEHRKADEVLAGYELDGVALAIELGRNGRCKFGVGVEQVVELHRARSSLNGGGCGARG